MGWELDNIVYIGKNTDLFCCLLQQHPLWGLRLISNRKLLLLEIFSPGYQLDPALRFLSDQDNSRTALEAELLLGEVGASPEDQWWVCAGTIGDPFPPQPLGWGHK